MVMMLQRSPPKIARFGFCGSTATVRLYQLCTCPTFTVVQPCPPAVRVASGDSSEGVCTIVGLATPPRPNERPGPMTVQEAPRSVDFRYQAVALMFVQAFVVPVVAHPTGSGVAPSKELLAWA